MLFSFFIWYAISFNAYLIGFYLKYFPGNLFTNSFSMAAADIAAAILSGFLIKWLRPKGAMLVAITLAIIGAFLYLFLFSYVVYVPIFIVLCRIGDTIFISTLYVCNSKLFPT